nr:hypothetical protein [Phytoactinopolyspora endophytica]
MKVVCHRAGNKFTKGTKVASVGTMEGLHIPVALSPIDDSRRVAEANQYEVEQQTTRPAIAIEKRMNALEGYVSLSQPLWQRSVVGLTDAFNEANPVKHVRVDLSPRGQLHAVFKGLTGVMTS